jgi:hypothetical protein
MGAARGENLPGQRSQRTTARNARTENSRIRFPRWDIPDLAVPFMLQSLADSSTREDECNRFIIPTKDEKIMTIRRFLTLAERTTEEQAAWRHFWTEVSALLQRAKANGP